MEDERKEFLVNIYNQMFNDINRHILVIWQSVAVLIGAFTIFALVEKNFMPIDVAISLIISIIIWLFAMIIDSSYWYNRNLAIIINIERQFLKKEDLKNIHYYFGGHRDFKMLSHLLIQFYFGCIIGTILILYHIITRVIPTINTGEFQIENFTWLIPYIVLIIGVILLYLKNKSNKLKYIEFIKNSPGITIDSSGITFGKGHPKYVDTNSKSINDTPTEKKSVKKNDKPNK